MDWVVLIASGALEAVWATALGAIHGLKRKLPIAVFLAGNVLSLCGLAFAMLSIPTGTAYAVWVGVGAVLTLAVAIVRRQEALTVARALLLLVLIGCVVGLKAVG